MEELKNKKTLEVAKEVLPKDKKPKMKNPKMTKPKYKDTEGLGMKIPLGRVAEIGGAFLGGAAVGATTLATEAALFGAGTAIEEGSLLAGLNSVKDTNIPINTIQDGKYWSPCLVQDDRRQTVIDIADYRCGYARLAKDIFDSR